MVYNLNEAAYLFLANNEAKKAIEIFKLNVSLNPNSWYAYNSLGEAYAKNGEIKLAIDNYEKSVALNPRKVSGEKKLKDLKKK